MAHRLHQVILSAVLGCFWSKSPNLFCYPTNGSKKPLAVTRNACIIEPSANADPTSPGYWACSTTRLVQEIEMQKGNLTREQAVALVGEAAVCAAEDKGAAAWYDLNPYWVPDLHNRNAVLCVKRLFNGGSLPPLGGTTTQTRWVPIGPVTPIAEIEPRALELFMLREFPDRTWWADANRVAGWRAGRDGTLFTSAATLPDVFTLRAT